MNLSNRLRRIVCSECESSRVFGPEEMLTHLRGAGMLRRDAKPLFEIVIELFTGHLANMNCEACGSASLQFGEWKDDFDDWGDARLCEVCKQEIPPERLEIFPDEVRCAACKDKPMADEAEFCSFCGGLLVTRKSSGTGITRYRSVCSDCGKNG